MPRPQPSDHQADVRGAAPPSALESHLGFLLKHAYVRYQSIQQPALAPFELDGRLLAVLTLIDADGPALQRRLSERLAVDRTTMVALVDALEARGLVIRERDPVDRRGQRVQLTAKGQRVVAQALAAVDAVEREFLRSLPRKDQRQFRDLLGKLADH